MNDTEKLKLLRKFVKENLGTFPLRDCQGMTARDEYDLCRETRKVLKQTVPNKTKEPTKEPAPCPQ